MVRDALIRWLMDLPTRVHLWRAERELRAVTVSGLSPERRMARERSLEALRTYRRKRQFPRNTMGRLPVPVFIDGSGRRCAVAQLVYRSGASDHADQVAIASNYARIRQIDSPMTQAWAASSGLTTKELARVQPSYPVETTQSPTVGVVNAIMLLLIPLGGIYLVASMFSWLRERARRLLPVLGLLYGFGALVFSTVVAFFAWQSAIWLDSPIPRRTMVVFEPSPVGLLLTFATGLACGVVGWHTWPRAATAH